MICQAVNVLSDDDKKIELFKVFVSQYFLNKSDSLERDRSFIMQRISFSRLDADSYYDLLVNDIRKDLLVSISRELSSIIDTYL